MRVGVRVPLGDEQQVGERLGAVAEAERPGVPEAPRHLSLHEGREPPEERARSLTMPLMFAARRAAAAVRPLRENANEPPPPVSAAETIIAGIATTILHENERPALRRRARAA